MEINKVDRLINTIKANKLKETQRNLERVQDAWANSTMWNGAMEAVGLASLPDPEGVSKYPEILEEWMIKAFSSTYSREEMMEKFSILRKEILHDSSRVEKTT